MNIIKNGKVLGKYNIIDALVIICIILLLAILIKFVFFKPEQTINLELTIENLPDYIYDNIQVGDSIILEDNKDSKIKEIILTSEKNQLRDIKIYAELLTKKEKQGLFFGDTEIKIGNTLDIKTEKVIIKNTKISQIGERIEKKYTNLLITILIPETDNWETEAIKLNSEEILENKTIAKIVNKNIIPTKITTLNEKGEIFEKQNPLKNDIELTINLLTEKKDKSYIYENQQLIVGEKITLTISNTRITGIITSIQ